MNYKNEIKRLTSRVPFKVINGSTNQAIAYKNAVERALSATSKARPAEAELARVLADLQVFE